MALFSRTLFLIVAVLLGSCAAMHLKVEPAVPLGHNFSYRVPNREHVNLIQVFDDGTNTYLQFKSPPPVPIAIQQPPNHERVSYLVEENYVKVTGVYQTLLVTVVSASTTVINEARPVSPKSAEQHHSPSE
jgi:hypothetical protein